LEALAASQAASFVPRGLAPLPLLTHAPLLLPATPAQEFFLRMEHEAQAMLASRFIPSLQFTGVGHEVDLLRLRVHKSAAGIAEALAGRAADLQA